MKNQKSDEFIKLFNAVKLTINKFGCFEHFSFTKKCSEKPKTDWINQDSHLLFNGTQLIHCK